MRTAESPWQALKAYGDRAFRGEAAAAANRLVNALDEIGLVLVRVGELENFAPGLGVSKGPRWLPAALQGGFHASPEAQAHVCRLVPFS